MQHRSPCVTGRRSDGDGVVFRSFNQDVVRRRQADRQIGQRRPPPLPVGQDVAAAGNGSRACVGRIAVSTSARNAPVKSAATAPVVPPGKATVKLIVAVSFSWQGSRQRQGVSGGRTFVHVGGTGQAPGCRVIVSHGCGDSAVCSAKQHRRSGATGRRGDGYGVVFRSFNQAVVRRRQADRQIGQRRDPPLPCRSGCCRCGQWFPGLRRPQSPCPHPRETRR